jgi:hypothetical protein
MTTKNALLTSVKLFVDLTTIHVTLHFKYANDFTQIAGPLAVSDAVLRALADVTGEREVLKIANSPCRVQVADSSRLAGGDEIVAFGHFLNEIWYQLTQPHQGDHYV